MARGREGHGLGLAALGVLAFSFTLPMTKIVVRGLDPVPAAAWRAVGATVLSAVAIVALRRTRPTRPQWRGLALVALGVVLGFPFLTAIALRDVPAGHGAVFTGLLPLATAGVAVVRAGERPSTRYWACSGLGFAAVLAFAVHEGSGEVHRADLLLLLAVAVAAVAYVEGALLARQMPGWAVIGWALVLSAPVTLVLALGTLGSSSPTDMTVGQWAAFAYTAAVSMFAGFVVWYAGMARAGVARSGQLQLVQPVLAVVWSWPLLGEDITPATALTAVAVLAAVALGRRADVAAAVPTPPPPG